jgi:7-keto-8-aminopelargonate synthetase-like enzyme
LNKIDLHYARTLSFISHSCDLGIVQLSAESDTYDGRILRLDDRDIVNFGNCSYVGLDVCEALKQGAIDATTHYGTFFSSSRLAVGLSLNEELEALLDQITGYHTLVTQSTSLGSFTCSSTSILSIASKV